MNLAAKSIRGVRRMRRPYDDQAICAISAGAGGLAQYITSKRRCQKLIHGAGEKPSDMNQAARSMSSGPPDWYSIVAGADAEPDVVRQDGRFGGNAERTGGGCRTGLIGASGGTTRASSTICRWFYFFGSRFSLGESGRIDEAGIRAYAELFIVALRGFIDFVPDGFFRIRVIPQQYLV